MVALKQENTSRDLLDMYWKEIKNYAPLSRQEEVEMLQRAKAGDEAARQEVVKANLRFVVAVAREYETAHGPPLIDLVAEGNLGMIEAIKRFDETRGFKFITYAVWWIRQAIFKTLASQSRSIRPPMNQINDLFKIDKKITALSQRLGRPPSPEEIAAAADISPERVRNAMEVGQRDVSFDEPVGDSEGHTLLSIMPAAEVAADEPDESRLMNILKDGLKGLDERESRIVHAYFGLGNAEPKTLEAIGNEMGITRERVRQLRNRALQKMRQVCGEALDISQN